MLVAAYVLAHWLTPLLRPFRDDVVVFVRAASPSLARYVEPDTGALRPLGELAWMLLVLVPVTLLSLSGLETLHRAYPSRALAVVSAPIAVASGLAFASLIIVTFHLNEWSRLFLVTFGALAAVGLGVLRPLVSRDARARPPAAGVAEHTPVAAARQSQDVGEAGARGVGARSRDRDIYDILERIARGGEELSQRSLARDVGIALGLTNVLLKRLIQKGLITATRVGANRVRYAMTPDGLAEKARLFRKRLGQDLQFYDDIRRRLANTLDAVAASGAAPPRPGVQPRIVVYGSGELTELCLMLLRDRPLDVVAVVGDFPGPTFFGRPVRGVEDIDGLRVAGAPFDRVLVAALDDLDKATKQLVARGVPAEAIQSIA